MKYEKRIIERRVKVYHVEADSEEEAYEKDQNGESVMVDEWFIDEEEGLPFTEKK